MSIEVNLGGLLFLLIIVVLVAATSKYGYEIFSDLDFRIGLGRMSIIFFTHHLVTPSSINQI